VTCDLKFTLVSAEVIARFLLAEEKSRKDLKVIYHHFFVSTTSTKSLVALLGLSHSLSFRAPLWRLAQARGCCDSLLLFFEFLIV
jgi:hypothetical protein